MKALILLLLLSVFNRVTAQELVGPEELTYMTENYPPANYHDKYGLLNGASVQILYALWDEMKCPKQEIKLYPWARGYIEIQQKERQVLFSMSRTEERENMFKWVGPIFTSRHVIVALKNDSSGQVIVSREELFQKKVAVIRDDVGEQSLRKIGFPEENLHIVSSQKQMIQLLMLNRVSYISLSDEALRDLVDIHSITTEFHVAYTLDIRKNYYAFSKDVPDKLIETFQQALENIEETHMNILKDFGMELYKKEKEAQLLSP